MLKGKYTPLRILQTTLVVGVFLYIIGTMVSGIMLSRHIFTFLNIRGVASFARVLHMLSAYWSFVLMSLHLGFHWSIMIGMARKAMGKPSVTRKWVLRVIGALIAVYGIYAFAKRDIWNYMILKNHFAFFDFEEPVIFFLLDYMAVMGLFVWLGHYVLEFIKSGMRNNSKR